MTRFISVGNIPEGVLRAAEKHSHMGSMKVNYASSKDFVIHNMLLTLSWARQWDSNVHGSVISKMLRKSCKKCVLTGKLLAHKEIVKCHLADSPKEWQDSSENSWNIDSYSCSLFFYWTSLWFLTVSWFCYRTSVWTLVTVLRLPYTPAVACSPRLISCPHFGMRTGSLCSACL